MLDSDQHKILFVNSLNILKCILHQFPSASGCEKKASNKILHWTIMCHFPGATFIFFAIIIQFIDVKIVLTLATLKYFCETKVLLSI